jgi:hypothetical protein
MSVNQFMSENRQAVQRIINGLPRPFDSHAFIRVFSREFQSDYVRLLSQYATDPFEKVHGQIGRFLAENQSVLGITAQRKVLSINIFGENSENEQWG